MSRYKTKVEKVTTLPNGVTLIPNTEIESDKDLTAYVRVGYLEPVDGVAEVKGETPDTTNDPAEEVKEETAEPSDDDLMNMSDEEIEAIDFRTAEGRKLKKRLKALGRLK